MTKPEDPNRVLIFDTTLRDGEQSPGISLNTQEKLEIAQQLARLGVDVIEAGFPITSPGDFEAVQAIARTVEGPVIAGLARTHVADIDAAYNAVKDAARPRIHTFISTSDIHIEYQLQTHPRGRQGPGPRRRGPRPAVRRGRGVLTDGRHPRRARVHRRGVPDRDRRGRDDDQHPRHRRLRDAARVRGVPDRRCTSWSPTCTTSCSRSTATTTSGWPSPTRWRGCARARGRWSARSTGSASGRATPRSRRS